MAFCSEVGISFSRILDRLTCRPMNGSIAPLGSECRFFSDLKLVRYYKTLVIARSMESTGVWPSIPTQFYSQRTIVDGERSLNFPLGLGSTLFDSIDL